MFKLFVLLMFSLFVNDFTQSENKIIDYTENDVYYYEIVKIDGNDVYGKALNNISDDNAGIYLTLDMLDFKVHERNVIAVIFNEYEDEFKSIELIKK